jgi:hypothetical protein
MGATLSALGVAFPDLRYVHFPNYNGDNKKETKDLDAA